MEINKEIIFNNLKELLVKDFSYTQFEERESDLKKVIDLICDETHKSIMFMSDKDTYVLRKRLGLFDEGEIQTLQSISKSVDSTIGVERVRQILAQDYRRITTHIRYHQNLKDNTTKMSSLSITDRFVNQDLSILGLDSRTNGILKRKGIKTLYDLLSYSYYDIKLFDGILKNGVKEMYEKIHELGLKFIEDLTEEEKRIVISMATPEMIDNSTIDWITGVHDYVNARHLSRIGKGSIADLKQMLSEQDSYIVEKSSSNDLSIVAKKKIGVQSRIIDDFHSTEEEQSKKIVPVDELLKSGIRDLDLSVRSCNCLLRRGIGTVSDLIKLNVSDLSKIRNMGNKGIQEIIDFVHGNGLFFADEVPVLKVYLEEIHTQLDSQSDSTLLQKYHALISEKTQLEARSKELDEEISSVMEQLQSKNKEVQNGQPRK